MLNYTVCSVLFYLIEIIFSYRHLKLVLILAGAWMSYVAKNIFDILKYNYECIRDNTSVRLDYKD